MATFSTNTLYFDKDKKAVFGVLSNNVITMEFHGENPQELLNDLHNIIIMGYRELRPVSTGNIEVKLDGNASTEEFTEFVFEAGNKFISRLY